jgi:DNA-binding transcriptional MerR regulator
MACLAALSMVRVGWVAKLITFVSMAWTDIVSSLAAVAACGTSLVAVIVARRTMKLQDLSAARQQEQGFLYSGAQAAIAWRQQVLDLHDRGLTPEQIRRIMELENGGTGYENGNGSIDEILRDVPRTVAVEGPPSPPLSALDVEARDARPEQELVAGHGLADRDGRLVVPAGGAAIDDDLIRSLRDAVQR